MGFRDISIVTRYQTFGEGDNSVLDGFYVPVLQVARRYDRLSGFFSSASFALAAKGLAALISHGGTMRMVCSPILSPADSSALEDPEVCLDEFSARYFAQHFAPTEDAIHKDHVAALAWLLKEGRLEIKLAVVIDEAGRIKPEALFHPKVGILMDADGDELSFSGSNNETASGWTTNQEEFKVFKSWEPGQRDFYFGDKTSFKQYWENRVKNVRCMDLPAAFREQLVKRSFDFSKEDYVRRHYESRQRNRLAWQRLNLFDYQKSAVEKWVANGKRLLFEMATGAGKTRCAIGCVNRFIEEDPSRAVCVVIAVPTNDLCAQWERELVGTIVSDYTCVVANSRPGHEDWRADLTKLCSRFSLGTTSRRVVIVVTTHSTACSADFIEIVGHLTSYARLFIIGDEVHGMGAREHKRALQEAYEARLGLSATPERMFDQAGTRYIREFFGDDSYEFSLQDALDAVRVSKYFYYPVIVPLTPDERLRYDDLSERIQKLGRLTDSNPDAEEKMKRLLIERALVIEAASEKLPALKKLIEDNKDEWRDHVLVFCCHKNLTDCQMAFIESGMTVSRFTFHEKDRERILKKFATGGFSALLAMKCLDEGIDIPDAHVAILVSSSTNPREYIQRIGRVIRKAPGKEYAKIYDFLVSPSSEMDDIVLRDFERARYVAKSALNSFEATEKLFPIFN